VLDRWVSAAIRQHATPGVLLFASLLGACARVGPAQQAPPPSVVRPAGQAPAQGRGPALTPPALPNDERARLGCTPTEHADLRRSNYCLGLSLHRGLLARQSAVNAVLSPLGLQADLSLSYVGASGETRRQIGDMLAFAGPAEELAAAFERQLGALSAYRARDSTPGGFTRHSVLFADDTLALKDSFLDAARTKFGALVKRLDFADSAKSVGVINDFSAKVTNGEIARALTAPLPPETRLVQLGSFYFHKLWASPFLPAAPGLFTLADGTRVELPTMRQRAELRHDRRAGCDVVELSYQAQDYSFFVVVPRERSLSDLERALTPEMLLELTSFLQPRPMQLSLPRFQLLPAGAVALRPVFEASGMSLPFDRERADFSASTDERHALHDIYQSVMVRVDEYGTTAAAVTTSVRIQTSGRELEQIDVNRPFLFLLRENNSGLLLLLGRVGDPRASG
jgi:serpin B